MWELRFLASWSKESLSEYGSGWKWDIEYPNAFDQTNVIGIPYRFKNNGITFDGSSGVCIGDTEITNGQILVSQSQMLSQLSCRSDVQNAGNYYNYNAAHAGNQGIGYQIAPNSTCPKGWKIIAYQAEKSSNQLLLDVYNVDTSSDVDVRYQPLSFVRSGMVQSSNIYERATRGMYWLDTGGPTNNANGAVIMYFGASSTKPTNNGLRSNGYSLRCVAR